MSTSGVYSVQYTRNDLITAAMRKMGVLAQGQTPTTANYTDGAMALNMAVSMFRALGMTLWTRSTYTFSTTIGARTYQIGTGLAFDTPYPLKLLQVYRTETVGQGRLNMDIESDYNLRILPSSATGIPTKLSYQPLNNYGELKVWPIPDASAAAYTFTLVYQRPFQYFIAATDTADFPEEWYLPLLYQAAVLWAPEWGLPLPDQQALEKKAEQYLSTVLGMGGEDASMFIQPYKQP